MISIGSTSGSQKEGGRGKGAQSLCQWQEVPAHPGLVTAVLQSSNNPVVLMLKPGSVAVQEIKVIGFFMILYKTVYMYGKNKVIFYL